MERDTELILTELRELRAELRILGNAIANCNVKTAKLENDVTWIRGSARIAATFVSAIVSAVIGIGIKFLSIK